jgi:hypothetical protein
MAKSRSARGGRKSKKTAKRPKAASRGAKRTAKKAAKRATKRPAAKSKAKTRKAPGRKAAARKAATRKTATRKAANRKTVSRKTAKPNKKAALRRAPIAPRPAPRPTAKTAPKAPSRKPLPRNAASAKANAEAAKKIPALNRERRRLAETDEELMPSAPSTLGYASGSSAARSGSSELRDSLAQHTETGPALTGGDVDASWEDAYAVGDEAPGGDNPTPDQDIVDEIGKALGVQYNDNEELKGAEKIQERDRHRWELDPASSDDYKDRAKDED